MTQHSHSHHAATLPQVAAPPGAPVPRLLRGVLLLDAAGGLAMALAHSAFAGGIADRTGIPPGLVTASGAALYPIAAFMAWTALRREMLTAAVWIVILGNVGWALASLALLAGFDIGANSLGRLYIAAQALGVLLFAVLEVLALRRGLPATARGAS
ncbi:MAG: hypothetical protein NW223_02915 [Hyphomicrobiaceae bacterium]|nr:hypothetical protein [Hyphomicrobiaceae bacterium]